MRTVHTVATLLYDAVNPFELGVATEVFGVERPELGVPWYRFLLCAAAPGPVRTSAGFYVIAPNAFLRVDEADTVIIPGPCPAHVSYPEVLLETVRDAYQRGARLIALCSGAFLLAAAGVLDGRRVTTHWRSAATLRLHFQRLVHTTPQAYRRAFQHERGGERA
jgi:AraC family transcriptional regulator, transcriptional activator FtrA